MNDVEDFITREKPYDYLGDFQTAGKSMAASYVNSLQDAYVSEFNERKRHQLTANRFSHQLCEAEKTIEELRAEIRRLQETAK